MKYLYGHTSQETAYIVEDYPWGFRLRTTIRYWIESKKGFGQRFCSQTIDPKTGLWCKPKCSTYSPLAVMFLNEDNHVKWSCVNHYGEKNNFINFKKLHFENLDQYQSEYLENLIVA